MKAAEDAWCTLCLKIHCEHFPSPAIFRPAYLTPRHRQALRLLSMGRTNKEIALVLETSYETVKTNFYEIFKRLQVRNRTEAALWAKEHFELLKDPPNKKGVI